MNKTIDILNDVIISTRTSKMIWYIDNKSKNSEHYVSKINITPQKTIVYRLHCFIHLSELYFSIKLINERKSKNRDGTDRTYLTYRSLLRLLPDNNSHYIDDLDLVYHTIKYSKPKMLP